MKFINGTYFKHQCRFQLTDYTDARNAVFSFTEDHQLDNDLVFCKTEYLSALKNHLDSGVVRLPKDFRLVTHNSDINFTADFVEALIEFFPYMGHWYAQNLLSPHPKASPIPIGIANPKWSHGNEDRFKKIIKENNEKDNLYYANFNISTNPEERAYCCHELGIAPLKEYPNAASISDHDDFVNETQEDYLRSMAKSYFTISPNGNGRDCHKTWEALYMRSIPIVTESLFARKFKEMGIPLLILDDWGEFEYLDLNKELYDEEWKDFDPASLDFSLFAKK